MSLETDVQALTNATTDLLIAVNVSKATLDDKVDDAGAFATASLNSANASAASASTATTQATAAGTARTGAETARDAAVVAQNNAVAVVTGGTATLTPSAGKIPLSDAQGKIAKGWLTNTDLVEQTDIGTGPNEIPLNQFLGELAYLDAQNIPTLGINVANANTANVTNLMQVTEISNAVPSLNLDFAKVKQLDPRITFTRASTGTYYDAFGVLQTAASGVPRFEHNPVTGESLGLEIEEQRTNLLIYSSVVAVTGYTRRNTVALANATIAPDGTLTATKLDETPGSNSVFDAYQSQAITSGATYTCSVYAKAGERVWFWIQPANGANQTWFNLSTGIVGTNGSGNTATITPVGNGWYRCAVTVVASSTIGYGDFGLSNADNTLAYTGIANWGLYIWGAQLEAGAFPTSYIPTTTAQVTRAADSAVMTGANFSSWYRQGEGTLYTRGIKFGSNLYPRFAGFYQNGLETNSIGIGQWMPNQVTSFIVANTVQTSLSSTLSGLTFGSNVSGAVAYATNDVAFSANGSAVLTDTSATIPVVNELRLGFNDGNSQLNGTLARITYYPQRLSNAELVEITA